jgi:fatty-acyl-CoA synthase
MGRFENGLLFVEGRDDDMIVSGGENVFPQEVEELLARHPAVAEAAVVGVPDDEFGQRLSAFVVRPSGAELDADTVRAHVREHLARHKVPRDVTVRRRAPAQHHRQAPPPRARPGVTGQRGISRSPARSRP